MGKTTKIPDVWFNKLPECTYSDLKKYYASTDWHEPRYYYCAANTHLGSVSPPAHDIRMLDGTPVARYIHPRGMSFIVVCPKTAEDALEVCRSLSSLTPFKIKVKTPNEILDPNFFEVYYTDNQVVYDCEHIVKNIREIIGNKHHYYIRRYDRECRYVRAEGPQAAKDMETVLDNWLKGPSGSKKTEVWHLAGRNLLRWVAESKDVYADYDAIPMIAYRTVEGVEYPVAYSCIVPIRNPKFPGWGIQAYAKCLNYSSIPGGGNSISDWELYRCCKNALEHGIKFLNGGGYMVRPNEHQNLAGFKYKYANRAHDFVAHYYKYKFTNTQSDYTESEYMPTLF